MARSTFDEDAVRTRVRELVAGGRTGEALEIVVDHLAAIARREREESPSAEAEPVDELLAPLETTAIDAAPAGARRKISLAHLPRVAIEDPTPPACRRCGAPARASGTHARELLEPSGGAYRIEVHAAARLACDRCGLASPIPTGVHPGPLLVAHAVVAAHGDGVSCGRQALAARRAGLAISASTIEDWIDAAARALAPIAREIRRRALGAEVLVARRSAAIAVGDQTWCAAYPSVDDARSAIETRRGWVVADDARRPHEAASWGGIRAALVAIAGDARAGALLALVQRLYRIDHAHADDRAARSGPVLDAIRDACVELGGAPEPLATIAREVLASWSALRRFVEDRRLPIDDAIVERALVGWRAETPRDRGGAERAAVLSTILGTCALVGVSPVPYVSGALRAIERGHRASRVGDLLPPAWIALSAP